MSLKGTKKWVEVEETTMQIGLKKESIFEAISRKLVNNSQNDLQINRFRATT